MILIANREKALAIDDGGELDYSIPKCIRAIRAAIFLKTKVSGIKFLTAKFHTQPINRASFNEILHNDNSYTFEVTTPDRNFVITPILLQILLDLLDQVDSIQSFVYVTPRTLNALFA
jgi:hypothetical protein